MAHNRAHVCSGLATRTGDCQKFTDPLHAKNLLRSLYEVKKISGVCDGRIIVEGKELLVQRSVLAAASPYFRALFSFDSNVFAPASGERQTLTLQNIKVSAFEDILEFIYSGDITIGEDNVQDLLQAADLLLMTDLKELCCDYLEQCINPNNCLGILDFTERFTCPRVNFKASEMLDTKFSVVCQSEEFLLLSEDRLQKILHRHRISVPSEEEVLASLLRWIQHSPERQDRLPTLLRDCIRVDMITHKPPLESLVASLITDDMRVPSTKNWQPRGHVDVLVVCGGYQGKDEVSRKVCCTELPPNSIFPVGNWISLSPLLMARAHHSVVEAGGCLYAVGGKGCQGQVLNTAEKYDPETNEWTSISAMKYARMNFGLLSQGDRIYAVGGQSSQGAVLTSIEEYNVYTNQWRTLPDMSLQRAQAAYAMAANKIYVIAGINSGKLYEAVEVFDPKSETWFSAPPLKERRFGAHAVGVGNDLYVFGGLRPLECPSAHNGLKFCQTETFCTESNGWCGCVPTRGMFSMTESSRIDKVLTNGEMIYVVGDLDIGGGVYHFVRGYHIRTNTWRDVVREYPHNQRFVQCGLVRISKAALWDTKLNDTKISTPKQQPLVAAAENISLAVNRTQQNSTSRVMVTEKKY